MGTSATIKFEYQGKPLIKLYKHYDGYIDALGHSMARWLTKKTLINGISSPNHFTDKYANGIGCLISKFIKDYKKETGDLYVVDLDCDEDWNDYNYIVDFSDDTGEANDLVKITVTCFDSHTPIFIGTPKDLLYYQEPEE